MLLYSIISKVNHPIFEIFSSKLFWCCSNVSFLIPIAPKISSQRRNQHITSNIKLSFIIKKRHEILLDNVWTFFPIWSNALISDNLSYLFNTFNNINTTSSIGILSWFDYPKALFLECLSEILPFRVSLLLNMISLWDVVKWIFIYSQIISL